MTTAGEIHDGLRGILERSRQLVNFIVRRRVVAVHAVCHAGNKQWGS